MSRGDKQNIFKQASPPEKESVVMLQARTDGTFTLGGFEFQPTVLVVHGKPTFKEWERAGDFIRAVNKGAQWWWGDWLRYGESREDWAERWSQAVEESGYEASTLETLKLVSENVPSRIRNRNVDFYVHKVASSLQVVEQKEFLQQAEANGWSVGDARRELRAWKRRSTVKPKRIEGKYRVVYADPPWAYNDSGVVTEGDAYGKAERHYPTQTVEEIATLPVREHVERDAVLFLWCTEPLRFEVLPVITAWGFTHKSAFIWNKVAHNYGHYISVRHEHLLICTRGSCTPDRPTPMPESIVTVKRTAEHSEKPAEFRQLIERLYDGPYVELYGRREVPGWTVYANQWLAAPAA